MPQPQGGTAGSLLLVDVLLYDRAKLLVGEPLLGVNLVGALAGFLTRAKAHPTLENASIRVFDMSRPITGRPHHEAHAPMVKRGP
jgi:hypothetical protein